METLKEEIIKDINEMDLRELLLVYQQIRLMRELKVKKTGKGKIPPLEEVHKLTSSSKSSWGEAVVSEREDRI